MVFLYSKWLSTPFSVRVQIASKLGIAKVRPTHVIGPVIADDGYNVSDVENALSIENLQRVLESKQKEMDALWEELIALYTPKPEPIPEPTPVSQPVSEPINEPVKSNKTEVIKRVTIKKTNAKKTKKGSKK